MSSKFQKSQKNIKNNKFSPNGESDLISPRANLDSYMGIWAEAAPGGGRPTPHAYSNCKVSIGDLDGKNDPISPCTNLDL